MSVTHFPSINVITHSDSKSCRQICKHCNIGVFTDFKRTHSVVNPTVFAAVEVIAFSAFSSSIPCLTAITAQSDRFSIVISGWSVIIATSIPLSERFYMYQRLSFKLRFTSVRKVSDQALQVIFHVPKSVLFCHRPSNVQA